MTDTSLPEFKLGALTTYQGVGGAIVGRGESVISPTTYGDKPDNGIFDWGAQRRIRGFGNGGGLPCHITTARLRAACR